jgi:hypothetical protein
MQQMLLATRHPNIHRLQKVNASLDGHLELKALVAVMHYLGGPKLFCQSRFFLPQQGHQLQDVLLDPRNLGDSTRLGRQGLFGANHESVGTHDVCVDLVGQTHHRVHLQVHVQHFLNEQRCHRNRAFVVVLHAGTLQNTIFAEDLGSRQFQMRNSGEILHCQRIHVPQAMPKHSQILNADISVGNSWQ